MKIRTLTFACVLVLLLSSLQPTAQPADRFDMLVRADFFAGFAGDSARLTRGLETCERVLAVNPKDAQALVWHGSGLMFQAGAAFAAGDMARGGELWGKGLGEADAAVAIAPDSVGVLIPRGAVLMQATRQMPPSVAQPLLASAVRNYERALEVQGEGFLSLGDHAKGELLFGLAEGYARLGDMAKARHYFERLTTDAAGSGQAPRARTWLATGSLPPTNGLTCVGCHK